MDVRGLPKTPNQTQKEHTEDKSLTSNKTEALEKLREARIETIASSVVKSIGSILPTQAVKIKEALVHYATSAPSEIHEFIRNVTAKVKGQSTQDKKTYDLNTSQGAADKLCSKYSKEEIKNAIDHLKTSNDPRFNPNASNADPRYQKQFSFDADKFYNNHVKDNPTTPSKQPVVKSDPTPDTEDITNKQPSNKELNAQAKIRKEIGNTLAALVTREPVAHTFKGQNGAAATLTQTVGHIETEDGVSTFVKGTTSSAEGQKTERVNELANQGSVTLKIDGESKLVVGRSARTSSEKQVKESSMGIISDKFHAEGKAGFIVKTDPKTGKEYYEFQKTDVSFMDTARLKQAFSRLSNAKNALFAGRPLEDERMFDGRHLAAIEKVWGNPDGVDARGPYIEHRINVGSKDTPDIKIIREYKPLFMNVVISSQAKTTSNLTTARERNVPSVLAAGKQLAAQLNDKELSHALENCERNLSPEHVQALQTAINNLKIEVPGAKPLDPKTRIALEGLTVLISGKLKGESIDTIAGTKTQLLYMLTLAEVTKMGVSVKCKSGNDRTAIGVSIAVARAKYEAVNGKPYDPSNSTAAQDREFAENFVTSMETFGRANVMGSRGPTSDTELNPVLKSKTHPLLALELGKLDSDRAVKFNRTVNLV